MRGFVSKGRAAGLLAVAVVAAAGCGGGGSSESSAAAPKFDPAREKAIAEQSRLRLADFPSGWRAKGQRRESKAKCAGVIDARTGVTARASSPAFSTNHEETLAQGGIYIYPDEQTAAAKFAALSSADTRTCLSDELTDGVKQQAKGKAKEFTVGKKTGRLPIDPIGDQRGAGRVTVALSTQGVYLDITVDFVFFRVGRAVAAMTFGETLAPFDKDLRSRLTRRVERRLTTSLEQAS